MKRLALAFAFLLTAAVSYGQGALSLPTDQELVKLSGVVTQRSGDDVRGTITAEIAKTWHINSVKPLDEFVIPTTLTLEGADLVRADFPPHELKDFTFSDGKKLAVYEGTIAIPFQAKLKNGVTSIKATLRYQSCNDSVCLPPKTVSADISTNVVAAPAPKASANFTPLSAAPKSGEVSLRIGSFEARGLPLTLLVLFLGGLALNLTPCVFPVIPITLGFFAMQSDGRRSRRFALSAAYVAGIVIMYATLGVVAAMAGKLFGAWLQSQAVLIFFAALMLVFATSMFGLWEFRVPQFVAARSQGRAGVAGAAAMGLLVGIVAAPCVGPVVAALFVLVASLAKPAIGFLMFATLGFGLGFPYLVALNALPRPGEWMVHVKRAMGFVLIAMSFYFLRAVVGEEVFRWGVAASLLIGGVFLFFVRGSGGRALRIAFAVALLIGGAAFAWPRAEGTKVAWQGYDAAMIASAHKPVIVDFYADWCIPCKELDQKTFSDAAVARELGRFARVKANLTNGDDAKVKELTKEYAIVGVPTVVFLDSAGHEAQALRLTGYEPAGEFLKRLQQVK
ncbi:MAG TPA: cytochrome c biogenesis protein CcdA [Thermoanaerobaculia bacterium]|nr:cytochrome c biogenesis protein CcdA [Thermoanaerobaculia bacterium]